MVGPDEEVPRGLVFFLVSTLILVLSFSIPLLALDPSRAVSQYRVEGWNASDGLPQIGTKEGLGYPVISAICEDREGSLWVGTQSGGLNRLKDGAFTTYGPAQGLTGDFVWTVFEDHSGGVWAGTDRNGLFLLRNGRFLHYGPEEGLTAYEVTAIGEDKGGTLWIGGRHSVFSKVGERFVKPAGSEALDPFFVLSITEDAEGGMWFCTSENGLGHYRDGRFFVFDRRASLPDGAMYAALDDGSGFLWISNRGIYRIRRSALESYALGTRGPVEVQQFGISDGMASSECNGGNQPAGLRTRDGLLWFPTMKGVVVTDPGKMSANAVVPPVVVEEVLVDGVERQPVKGVLAVPPGTRSLEIQYTALSLLFPERVRFRYRLAGYDGAWVEAGSRRTAYCTGLPPGDFTFKLTACNNDGVWNETGASLRVHVAPSFYQMRSVQAPEETAWSQRRRVPENEGMTDDRRPTTNRGAMPGCPV